MPLARQFPAIAAGLALTLGASASDWLILSNLILIDGTGAPPRVVETLIAKDGVLVHLGESRTPDGEPLDMVQTIELEGSFVLPGLIDTHVHVARFPETRRRAQQLLEAGLRGGVTAVRDVGGDARALFDIQRASIGGEILVPTVVYSGVYGGPSLFSDPRITAVSTGYAPGEAPWARAVDARTDIALAVAQTKGAGAIAVKIYGNLGADLVTKLTAEAKRQNLGVWAHGTVFPTGPQALVDAGVDVLSHAPYLVWAAVQDIPEDYGARTDAPWSDIAPDHPRIVALLESMVARGVSLDATLFIFNRMHSYSPEVRAEWAHEAFQWGARLTALAHQLGVRVTVGTDWFEPQNEFAPPNTHQEMQLLVEQAGLSPLAAIVAATRNGAEALGIAGERGTVEVGKAADLLVLESDPLEDITRTATSIRFVVKDGKIARPLR
jgi:imidazolonepropionase-like amidohydrolase